MSCVAHWSIVRCENRPRHQQKAEELAEKQAAEERRQELEEAPDLNASVIRVRSWIFCLMPLEYYPSVLGI